MPTITNGQGSIRITITLPENSGIASVTVFKDAEVLSTLEVTSSTIVYESSVDAGDYFIHFSLKDSNDTIIAIVSELVLVRAGMPSEKTIPLQVEDLKFIAMVPTGLTAEPQNNGSISLAWNVVAGADEYTIYRSDASDGTYEPIGTSSSSSYTDTGVAASTTYYYKVSAVNNNRVESAWSLSAFATTRHAPGITINPGQEWDLLAPSQVVVKDDTHEFSVNGTYTAYQWYLEGQLVRTDSTYIFDAAGKAVGDVYKLVVVVMDSSGEQRSGTCRITIIESNTVPYNAGTSEELTAALSAIQSSAEDDFTITVSADFSISPVSLTDAGYNGKTITLKGDSSERTISLSSTGSFFTLNEGVTFILDSNITLMGREDNTESLVLVDGGKLVMNDGAKVTGNTATCTNNNQGKGFSAGIGIINGSFTMNGGEVSNNSISVSTGYEGLLVGGVSVKGENAIFTMNGGTISDNHVSSDYAHGAAGGVDVSYGAAFIMNDGEISRNTIYKSFFNGAAGGGVTINIGTFVMKDGKIIDNIADFAGSRGVVGGGVCLNGNASFSMEGGTISGNSTTDHTFAGGGVYAMNAADVFTKTGGIIYGYGASTDMVNTINGTANAVRTYQDAFGTIINTRNTTADVDVVLDSTQSGSAGGWE
jgi:hypothetical protein